MMCMKGENQALRLERLMQNHQIYPAYELCFPFISVKKSALKKLKTGDLFLLGMAHMEMLLLSKNDGCAKAVLAAFGKSMTLQIVENFTNLTEESESKKYKKIKIVLGSVRSRMLEPGHKVEMAEIDFSDISLYGEEKKVAHGRLVMVDDEIAVQIKEVIKQ